MIGQILSLAGTNIPSSYASDTSTPTSTVINPSGARRVRFYANFAKAGGSAVTTVTMKLRQRFNASGAANLPGAAAGAWLDLPSTTDAATPVLEVEHAFTVSALSYTFYLDVPAALLDVELAAHANAVGTAGDLLSVYYVLD